MRIQIDQKEKQIKFWRKKLEKCLAKHNIPNCYNCQNKNNCNINFKLKR